MKNYSLYRCLHYDSKDEAGNIIPNQPSWDTLLGFCNPYATAHTFKVHCFGQDGVELPLSPLPVTLEPGESLACTFIDGNEWTNPPQNWAGHIEIEFPDGIPLPVAGALGGNGPGWANWNGATPSVQIFDAPQVRSGVGSRWVFPYAIPYFRDPEQHADKNEYRTGLGIKNRSPLGCGLTIDYIVGKGYANAGKLVTAFLSLGPLQEMAWQLHELFPEVLTMNPRTHEDGTPLLNATTGLQEYEGSEGWLQVTCPDRVDLLLWLDCVNRDYDMLSFSQAPWLIE